jgi:protein involved in ribonucleotide reduction
MLDIIYFSNVSNNTTKFVQKLGWKGEVHRIPLKGTAELHLSNQYVLICPSYGEAGHGHVPPQVRKFLANETYRTLCVGVIGAGSLNFGEEYAIAGDMIAAKLNVPLLYKFDLAGNTEDVQKVTTGLLEFGQTENKPSPQTT